MSTATATATPRTMSLRVHVAILLIFTLVLVSGGLGWLGYRHATGILESSLDQLIRQIGKNVELSVRTTYAPAGTAVDLLSQSGLTGAGTLEARLAYLPLLNRALEGSQELAAVYAGYDDGDFLIVRRLDAAGVRARTVSPPGAAFSVDSIETRGGVRQGLRLHLDRAFEELARESLDDVSFDPRTRPWYRDARDAAGRTLTDPYRFALSATTGVTLARRFGAAGGVIGADVTLDALSGTLSATVVTKSAQLLLLDRAGQVLAASAPVGSTGLDAAPDAAQTGNQVVNAAIGHLKAGGAASNHFEALGRRWVLRQHAVDTGERGPLQVVVIAPEDELLAEATALVQGLAFTALALVPVLIVLAWLMAGLISRPLVRLARQTHLIRRFDFRTPVDPGSRIREIDGLAGSLNDMKSTIGRFLALIGSLSREGAYDRLLDRVLDETMRIGAASAGAIFLLDDEGDLLVPACARLAGDGDAPPIEPGTIALAGVGADAGFAACVREQQTATLARRHGVDDPLAPLFDAIGADELDLLVVPLTDRGGRTMGMLCLAGTAPTDDAANGPERVAFVEAVSGFAAVSLETQRLLVMEKELLDAFIRLVAGAIDAKSPYTGGHCQRVPELTLMLAQAACASDAPPFEDFTLDEDGWEELRVAAWLHDCGKVTTPEYVVDKATKLETIYDRIHEIRMRFEVLKRDAELAHLQRLVEGEDTGASQARLAAEHAALDADFEFVAQCNQGGEFMASERVERLQSVAARTWRRTLDDRIGISWEERERKARSPAPVLPVDEPLLADRPEHLLTHDAEHVAQELAAGGFRIPVPEHAYNRGELYNLAIGRGTLSPEERFKINDHIVQTIRMLEKLPFPKRLRDVPLIAGGHHEKMDGTGYPRGLTCHDMPLSARMMAIADIFEALTASDRPYKKAKTLSEAIRIMSFMRNEAHVDPDLFDLFLTSGVYREYAATYLDPSQVDEVDVEALLSAH